MRACVECGNEAPAEDYDACVECLSTHSGAAAGTNANWKSPTAASGAYQ